MLELILNADGEILYIGSLIAYLAIISLFITVKLFLSKIKEE